MKELRTPNQAELLKVVGESLSRSDAASLKSAPSMEGGSLRYEKVVRDIAWDGGSGHLIVLLPSAMTGAQGPALDLYDPETRKVERFALRLPSGVENGIDLSQITVGHRYLYLRAHKGDSPTLRLDRSLLQGGRSLRFTCDDEMEAR